MIYFEDYLKTAVTNCLDQNTKLKASVKLVGYVEPNIISNYYNSSDYFVLGSHYEGSGFSLSEAMACGIIPIVTDIHSFRTITAGGKIGGLLNCGDSNSFYENAREVIDRPIVEESNKVINYYRKNLSYPAIAQKAKFFYETINPS